MRDINPEKSSILTEKVPGIVESNDDPEKAGRIKVRVPPLHGQMSVNQLPWAYPVRGEVGSPSPNTDQNNDVGDISIPKEGTLVYVTHQNGDPNQIRYHESVYHKQAIPDRFKGEEDDIYQTIESNKVSGEIQERGAELPTYPNVKGSKYGPVLIEVEYGDNPRYLLFVAGTRFEILSDGTIVKHAEGDQQDITVSDKEVYVGQDLTVRVEESVKETVGQTYTLETDAGARIRLQGRNIYLN